MNYHSLLTRLVWPISLHTFDEMEKTKWDEDGNACARSQDTRSIHRLVTMNESFQFPVPREIEVWPFATLSFRPPANSFVTGVIVDLVNLSIPRRQI